MSMLLLQSLHSPLPPPHLHLRLALLYLPAPEAEKGEKTPRSSGHIPPEDISLVQAEHMAMAPSQQPD